MYRTIKEVADLKHVYKSSIKYKMSKIPNFKTRFTHKSDRPRHPILISQAGVDILLGKKPHRASSSKSLDRLIRYVAKNNYDAKDARLSNRKYYQILRTEIAKTRRALINQISNEHQFIRDNHQRFIKVYGQKINQLIKEDQAEERQLKMISQQIKNLSRPNQTAQHRKLAPIHRPIRNCRTARSHEPNQKHRTSPQKHIQSTKAKKRQRYLQRQSLANQKRNHYIAKLNINGQLKNVLRNCLSQKHFIKKSTRQYRNIGPNDYSRFGL